MSRGISAWSFVGPMVLKPVITVLNNCIVDVG